MSTKWNEMISKLHKSFERVFHLGRCTFRSKPSQTCVGSRACLYHRIVCLINIYELLHYAVVFFDFIFVQSLSKTCFRHRPQPQLVGKNNLGAQQPTTAAHRHKVAAAVYLAEHLEAIWLFGSGKGCSRRLNKFLKHFSV